MSATVLRRCERTDRRLQVAHGAGRPIPQVRLGTWMGTSAVPSGPFAQSTAVPALVLPSPHLGP